MSPVPDESAVQDIGKILQDSNRPLKERFRALFTLKNLGGQTAIDSIGNTFSDSSALLKHELAYCLGQMQDQRAIPILCSVLENKEENPMVRHEAGEALGAIGSEKVLQLLEQYANDPVIEVAETCQLAVKRIQWLNGGENSENLSVNPFESVDPAPPSTSSDVSELQKTLLDESQPLFDRYRAMFSLRNLNSEESVLALVEGFKCSSALFRHEIAYVLGQMQHKAAVQGLKQNLQLEDESPMVRHECAEALGSIATTECMSTLETYLKDDERVVKESCEVALDMCDYEQSTEFQYADALGKVDTSGSRTTDTS